MQKTVIRTKEVIKVAAVSVLSIGIFSAAFTGFNRLTFEAATSAAEPLPVVAAPAVIISAPQVYEAPELTVVASPFMNQHENNTLSPHAMPMEEAAQIGAEYIWDLFGECIDGMEVEMLFAAWPSQSRTYWMGTVGSGADDERFRFMIDAITGMRIDITAVLPQPEMSREEMDLIRQRRSAEDWQAWAEAWYYKTNYERVEYLGLTMNDVEPYLQAARQYAERHFNNTTVMPETERFSLHVNRTANINIGEASATFGGIVFWIEDNTGREIVISIINGGYLANIGSQHNDFIPGFRYEREGIG